jgi:hypothetical protein
MALFADDPNPIPPDFPTELIPGGAPAGGFTGWVDNLLVSGTFFAVFFVVVALLMTAGIVTTIVMLIRGKGRRYVMMEVDNDGTMRPASMTHNNAGFDMHNAAHQQAVQQAMNQQSFPPGS